MYFNACAKCKGTIVLSEDHYGQYLQCINCSRIIELEPPSRVSLATQDGKQAALERLRRPTGWEADRESDQTLQPTTRAGPQHDA